VSDKPQEMLNSIIINNQFKLRFGLTLISLKQHAKGVEINIYATEVKYTQYVNPNIKS